ncbi:uncharacterized protein E0L32_010975 [Thyridium curvatum]|uniref:1-alkyl-2-acetylglycerophosphocholine esterase n=1 Tax=Thyridium curvatum TaxID=1093900 RepID=A0A507AS94_9PEZI|nr:uncharacterized protein E0L32_010975 [Thyridium curvatum]TPX07080.1 hypothetical protein E0L32_010975 [Thyridium curvatum]
MRFTPTFFAVLLGIAEAIVLPEPVGPYKVAHAAYPLTDKSRIDPYAPSNASHPRSVMISVFWPVDNSIKCTTETAPYMPPASAKLHGILANAIGLPNSTFADFSVDYCRVTGRKGCGARRQMYPLAIFSPGFGNSRLTYSALAKSVASYGYIVVTVDHPYDANIVEFPDGTVIYGGHIGEDDASLEQAVKVRGEDITFVLSQLLDGPLKHTVARKFPGQIACDKVLAFGHSLGGASSAAAMLSDKRILGGTNLDGKLIEPVLSKGLDRPFFLLGRPNHRQEETTWVTFWDKLRGPKVEEEVLGATHGSFTDYPLLVNVLNIPEAYRPAIEAQFGTVKDVNLVTKTVANFFEFVLSGKAKPLLEQAASNSSGLRIVGQNIGSL